ncbi:MAG: hypothetical protein Q9214_004176 [Letrouitia sp. 1 TL-2023]
MLSTKGYHNLAMTNESLHDPSLTPHGEEQCRTLSDRFPSHNKIDLIVTSPIRRCIYTSLLCFKPALKRGVRVVALPEIQETSDLPCDTGSDLETLSQEFKDQEAVDLTLVHEGWNSKEGKWLPTSDAIEARCREARRWLEARPEKEIVVVTHGGLLHYLTEDWTESGKFSGTGWENTEFRTYHFLNDNSGDASMTETTGSKKSRRGSERSLTKKERIELRETAKKNWEQHG